MKRLIFILIAVMLFISLAACRQTAKAPDITGEQPPLVTEQTPPPVVTDPTPTPAPANAFKFTRENMPVIDGSTANIPLIEAVYSVLLGIPRNEAAQMVNTSGTDDAYSNLLWGNADILLVYSPSPNTLRDYETELEMAPIGRDGLVFLVNIANPVETLSPEQLVSIYSGQTCNWAQVGGEDVEIKAFQRQYRSGSQTMMNELVMKGVPMANAASEYVISEMGGLIDTIAEYDNAQSAIGYNVYYFVSQMEMNENVRMLSVSGVAPSTQSISDGSYPFVSDFYAVIKADTPEDSPARVLYDWIQSADGQNLVKHEGYATAG